MSQGGVLAGLVSRLTEGRNKQGRKNYLREKKGDKKKTLKKKKVGKFGGFWKILEEKSLEKLRKFEG